MNTAIRKHISSAAAFCGFMTGLSAALASLLHAAAAGIADGAQWLHIVELPSVASLTALLLDLRAQAFTAGGAFFIVFVLLGAYLAVTSIVGSTSIA